VLVYLVSVYTLMMILLASQLRSISMTVRPGPSLVTSNY
jgi:hypothetical protein